MPPSGLPSVRHRRRLLPALLALQLIVTGPGWAQASRESASALPALGDGNDMTPGTERRLGDRIAREIYRDPDYIDDPLLEEYVLGIWEPLKASAQVRGDLTPELADRLAWEVMLIRDRSINAFALPGGYMGVHLGLISLVANRAELASVMAHELSHITQRHIARQMTMQGKMAPWMMAAMILGVLAASKSAAAANASIVGSQALAAQSQLNFSRDMEREADRVGFGVMTEAGFDGLGFVTMFDKLQTASRLNDSGGFPYLRSHPLTTERIGDMQARMQLDSPGAPGGRRNPPVLLRSSAAPTDLEHQLMAARAKVLVSPGADSLRAMMNEALGPGLVKQSTERQAAAWYLATLAAIKTREFDAAQRSLARLEPMVQKDARSARAVRLLAAELALARDLPGKAVSLVSLQTSARPDLLLAAAVQTRLGSGKEASQRLQEWLVGHPRDALAWEQLATTSTALGQNLRALRASAEMSAARLDYGRAIDSLRAAQDRVRTGQVGGGEGDHIEASIIDARRKDFESVVREQTAER